MLDVVEPYVSPGWQSTIMHQGNNALPQNLSVNLGSGANRTSGKEKSVAIESELRVGKIREKADE